MLDRYVVCDKTSDKSLFTLKICYHKPNPVARGVIGNTRNVYRSVYRPLIFYMTSDADNVSDLSTVRYCK